MDTPLFLLYNHPVTITTPRPGRPRIHPWHVWADGTTHLLRRHVDYTCQTVTMKGLAHAFAYRWGLKAATRVVEDGAAIELRLYHPPKKRR